MKHLLTIVFAIFLGLGASAQENTSTNTPVNAPDSTSASTTDPQPETPQLDIRDARDLTPDDFLWLNRLIVVFADTDRDPSFQTQMELLQNWPQDLLDRDVVVITDTDPTNLSAFRLKLRPRGFGFVLVDKDGKVKLRKPSPWDVREIASSIDKTDLRQQELRDQRSSNHLAEQTDGS